MFVDCFRKDKKALHKEYLSYQAEMNYDDIKIIVCNEQAIQSNRKDEYIKCHKDEIISRKHSA